jgi:uncharacterized protein with beta-barrel porin domain
MAYPTQMWGIALEPFGGLACVSVNSDNFHERGVGEGELGDRGPSTAARVRLGLARFARVGETAAL